MGGDVVHQSDLGLCTIKAIGPPNASQIKSAYRAGSHCSENRRSKYPSAYTFASRTMNDSACSSIIQGGGKRRAAGVER